MTMSEGRARASVGQPPAVFVSSQAVDRSPAKDLVTALRSAGLQVEHSPSERDPRWVDWYEVGLVASLLRCRVFVIVLDGGWDSSTWMAQEAASALEAHAVIPPLHGFYWNPARLTVRAAGMV